MNERIKERNELAKQCFSAWINNNEATQIVARKAISYADVMIETLYEGEPEVETKEATAEPLAVVYDENGKPMGIRVRTLDVDFTLALQDLEGGDCYSFDSAQEKLKELGLRTFNKKEALAVAMYIEEINKAMEEVGGKPFEKDVYVTSELYRPVGCAGSGAAYSWYFYGAIGCVNPYRRSNSYFRCRPCLA